MESFLAGKVALVTGGSSGIGRASALALAAQGVRVAVGSRRIAEGEETVRLISQQGGEACFVQTDVSQPDQMQRLVEAAVSRWGRLDFALNNAGIEGTPYVSTADYSVDVWDQVIAVNLTGVFLAMKYEIPHMVKNGGSIVNMSSVAGLIGGVGGAAYHASKHGVIGLTRTAALEYARQKVRVNAICPAIIKTDMADRFFQGRDEQALADIHPLGRLGTPQEIADAVVWLCSDKSSFVTGSVLPVDGGLTAK